MLAVVHTNVITDVFTEDKLRPDISQRGTHTNRRLNRIQVQTTDLLPRVIFMGLAGLGAVDADRTSVDRTPSSSSMAVGAVVASTSFPHLAVAAESMVQALLHQV